MENIDNVKLFIRALNESIDNLEESLDPILSKSLDQIVESKASNHDKLETYNRFSYILVSVVFSYFKTVGISTDNHPILAELERVKVNMKRLKDLNTKSTIEESQKEKRDAQARSFVQNTLSKHFNNKWTKEEENRHRQPAVSVSNFKGKHTRFQSGENDGGSTPCSQENTHNVKTKGKKVEKKRKR